MATAFHPALCPAAVSLPRRRSSAASAHARAVSAMIDSVGPLPRGGRPAGAVGDQNVGQRPAAVARVDHRGRTDRRPCGRRPPRARRRPAAAADTEPLQPARQAQHARQAGGRPEQRARPASAGLHHFPDAPLHGGVHGALVVPPRAGDAQPAQPVRIAAGRQLHAVLRPWQHLAVRDDEAARRAPARAGEAAPLDPAPQAIAAQERLGPGGRRARAEVLEAGDQERVGPGARGRLVRTGRRTPRRSCR